MYLRMKKNHIIEIIIIIENAKEPVSKDSLTKKVNGSQISLKTFLVRILGILSTPHDLFYSMYHLVS